MHGYLADKKSFFCQYPFFNREFNVFALDFKGFGENKGMEYPYSLDDYVLQLVQFMQENDIVRPHVIAHSFGARVALKAIYNNPDIFDRIVLTGAAGLKPKKTFRKTVKKGLFSLFKKFVQREKLTKFYSKDYIMLDSVMKESFKKIISEHLNYVLPCIKNKTLLVFGSNDKETPLYMAKYFKRNITDSRLCIINGAGHFAFIDKSNKFNVEVREFLLSKD